jgi:DNA polymerase alpha subunit A
VVRFSVLLSLVFLPNVCVTCRNKTLNGGRAERNEYILLHEFHRLKYICPDKTWGKKAAAAIQAEPDDDDPDAPKKTKGKRDKYKGGLVFAKRGLWDKFILDFNSLYPSIIQEYNIDFTTIDSKIEDEVRDRHLLILFFLKIISGQDGEEKIPEPPSKRHSPGCFTTAYRDTRQSSPTGQGADEG